MCRFSKYMSIHFTVIPVPTYKHIYIQNLLQNDFQRANERHAREALN